MLTNFEDDDSAYIAPPTEKPVKPTTPPPVSTMLKQPQPQPQPHQPRCQPKLVVLAEKAEANVSNSIAATKLRSTRGGSAKVSARKASAKVSEATQTPRRLNRPVSAKYRPSAGGSSAAIFDDSDDSELDKVDEIVTDDDDDDDASDGNSDEVDDGGGGYNDDHQASIFDEISTPSDIDVEMARKGYEELRARWMFGKDQKNQMTDFEVSQQLMRNFGVDLDELCDEEVGLKYDKHQAEIETISLTVKANLSLFGSDGDMMMYNLGKARHQCRATRDLLMAMHQQKCASKEIDGAKDDGSFIVRPSDEDADNKQKMLMWLYDKAAQHGYRRYRSMLYAPITTSEGYNTHAYRECMSISDFVLENCRQELNYDHWKYITKMQRGTCGQVKDIADTLNILPSYQLPVLERDRHKFSFRNGILLTRVESRNADGTKHFSSKFYPYNNAIIAQVDKLKVSANYFNREYVEYAEDMDWYDIPTEVFQYVLEYQFGEHEDYEGISRMMYMNIGRMLFNRGDLDNWQYMCVLLGIAGTGKSTIIDYVLKRIYAPFNRAEVDNTIEEGFGLGALFYESQPRREKEIFMTTASELKHNCHLDLGLLLKMISGEEITAAMKSAAPVTFEFPTHFIMAANTWVTAWKDDNGNVKRRVQMFKNNRKIRKRDKRSDLGERLSEELPRIIQKSVRAYHYYVNRYGLHSANPTSIEMFEPAYFNDTRQELGKMANTLFAYIMDSGRITIAPGLVLSEEDMYMDYREYCRSVGKRHEVNDKTTQFSDLAQTISEYYDDETMVVFERRADFMYEGTQHWQERRYFLGLGLSARLTESAKEQAERRLAMIETANHEAAVNRDIILEGDGDAAVGDDGDAYDEEESYSVSLEDEPEEVQEAALPLQ